MDGPDAPLEVTTFITFGGGVDIKLFHDILIGVELAVHSPQGNTSSFEFGTTVHAGLFLGYSWKR